MTWKPIAILALVCLIGARSVHASDDPAAEQRIAAARSALIAPAADANDRKRAAQELFVLAPATLGEILESSKDDALVISILDAIAVRADAERSGFELTGAVFALLRDAARKDVAAAADRTLRAMDRADRALKLPPEFRVRRELQARLRSKDAEQIRLASSVLAALGDLGAADDLVEVLEETRGVGPLADAAADGLEMLLFKSFGSEPAPWREYVDGLAARGLDSYVAVLRETLLAERTATDQELLKLKIELDENDPPALIGDLSHRLPAVRRFAAEALARRAAEWDVEPAREPAIAGIRRNLGHPEVSVALLGLLEAIERKAARNAPDAQRDAALVLALGSGEPAIVAAAARAATAFPSPEIRAAVASALSAMADGTAPQEARTALVQAVGTLGLGSARVELERLLAQDESVDVRVAVAGALGAIRDSMARPALEKALAEDKQWRVRRRAAKELAALDLAAATPALLRALDDARPEVRGESALALAESKVATPEVVSALVSRLSTETAVLSELVRALGRLRARDALDELCAVAGRLSQSVPGSGTAQDAAAIDLLVRDLKEAFERICGDDIEVWNSIASKLAAVDHAVLTVFACSQPVRILLARTTAASGGANGANGGNGDGPRADGAALLALQHARVALVGAALAANDLALAESVTSDALAVEGSPDLRFRFLLDRATVLVRLDRLSEALAIYDDLLAEKKDRPKDDEQRRLAVLGAARAHDLAGNADAVVALLSDRADLDADLSLLLARAERRAKKPDSAKSRLLELRAGIAQNDSPFDLELRCELVETHLELGEFDAALAIALPDPATLPKDTPKKLLERLDSARKRRDTANR